MENLIQLSIRSTILAALVVLCLWRVKSASLKHAVWTVFAAGMLLMTVAGPLIPSLPLPVLRPVELSTPAPPVASQSITVTVEPAPASRPPVWPLIVTAIYFTVALFFLAYFALALFFTQRLVRRSKQIAPGRYESSAITVPMTAWSKVLLPRSWTEWDSAKLSAVLAHEEAHVRRRDSLLALIARLNRCLLWFHPLAWWIERELARLAELACDDAALATVEDRQQYARALLDMARTVHDSQGRLLTAHMFVQKMAKETNVETRIDRILNAARIPKAFSRKGWLALIALAAPVIYFTAAVRLAPAQTPHPPTLIAQAPAPPPQPPQPVQRPQSAQLAQQAQSPQPAQVHASRAADLANRPFLGWQIQDLEAELKRLELLVQDGAVSQRELDQLRAQEAQVKARQAALEDQVRQAAVAQERQRVAQGKAAEAQLLAAARAELQAAAQAQQAAQSGLSVTIAPERNVTVAIPLGSVTQGEAIATIGSTDGGKFNVGLRHAINGSTWEIPLSLKPGSYRIRVAIRNTADGTMETKELTFDVR